MAPRGLSAEEKRIKLLEIFHETKDFYQLKELEKLGPKLKGIVSQSVKEVLQSLMDDNLVQMDKVGSANFYWSFPSQASSSIVNQIKDIKCELDRVHGRGADIESLLVEERKKREPSEGRFVSLARLRTIEEERDSLLAEKSAFAASNPQQVELKKRAGVLAREAAERFTDNVLATLRHVEAHGMYNAREALGIRDGWEDFA